MRTFLVCLTALLLLVSPVLHSAEIPTMPVEQLQRGMNGVGKTVFQGTRIEEFDVEILGVLRNWNAKSDLILAKLSGKPGGALARTGQVIAGMSGSPVYVEGKLIGAVAHTWSFAKEPIAGITPIGEMLNVMREDRQEEMGSLPQQVYPLASSQTAIPVPKEIALANPQVEGLQGATLKPIATPLVLSGFDSKVIQQMTPQLAEWGLIPLQGGGTSAQQPDDLTLEPGSPLGVQLVGGDLSATGIGTLTYRRGDQVVALGHEMLLLGTTSFPMTGAYIYDVMPSQYISFKLGAATQVLGTIQQDRYPGVAGVIGQMPDMLPVRVQIGSASEKEKYQFQVIRDRELCPYFTLYSLYNTVLVAEKLYGDATIKSQLSIRIEGYPALRLQNLYSGHQAIYQACVHLLSPLYAVVQNPFKKVRIKDVRFDIEVQERIRSAWISGVRVDKKTVRPGEEVQATVTLEQYLGQRFFRKIPLKIPEDVPEGKILLWIGNAGTYRAWEEKRAPDKYQPKNLPHLLQILSGEEKNNTLIVQLFRPEKGLTVEAREMPSLPASILAVMESSKQTGQIGSVTGTVIVKKEIRTDFVLSGSYSVPLEVSRENK